MKQKYFRNQFKTIHSKTYYHKILFLNITLWFIQLIVFLIGRDTIWVLHSVNLFGNNRTGFNFNTVPPSLLFVHIMMAER